MWIQAGMGALALRLLTFKRWNDEIPYARKFFIAFGFLLLELAVENFFTWFVGIFWQSPCMYFMTSWMGDSSQGSQ